VNIVVLDGHPLNPGDLDWEPMGELGGLRVYDRSSPQEVLERSLGAQIALTNKCSFDRATIEALADLRYIGVLATGYNVVDLEAARRKGIVVTNIPAYSTPSVAQHVFALLLELCGAIGIHDRSVKMGNWSSCPDFSYTLRELTELQGLNLGLIGYGNIGNAVARIARAFGMEVLVHTRTPGPDREGLDFVDLESLLRRSDVISLHCPLTEDTRGLIGPESLALMKKSAILINTGRGPLVDETALARALNEGRIAGAGLDVLSSEPPFAENPLLRARNCIITPHIAWASRAARQRLMDIAVENVRGFIEGKVQNQVN